MCRVKHEAGGKADIVCILADASQLERSLYMLADFAGICVPAVLLLNMMDVAEGQGKKVDAKKLEKLLGIPVLPFVAAGKKQYEKLYSVVEKALREKKVLDTGELENIYKKIPGKCYEKVLSCMPQEGIVYCGCCSRLCDRYCSHVCPKGGQDKSSRDSCSVNSNLCSVNSNGK